MNKNNQKDWQAPFAHKIAHRFNNMSNKAVEVLLGTSFKILDVQIQALFDDHSTNRKDITNLKQTVDKLIDKKSSSKDTKSFSSNKNSNKSSKSNKSTSGHNDQTIKTTSLHNLREHINDTIRKQKEDHGPSF